METQNGKQAAMGRPIYRLSLKLLLLNKVLAAPHSGSADDAQPSCRRGSRIIRPPALTGGVLGVLLCLTHRAPR